MHVRSGVPNRSIVSCRRGATAIDYALIAALITAAIIGGLTVLGGQVQGFFDFVVGLFAT